MSFDKLRTSGVLADHPPPFALSLSKGVFRALPSRPIRPRLAWRDMAFWAYLLRCGDGKYYAGHTDNLEYRVGQHQAGRGSDFTARRQPVALVWSQDFGSRIEALEAEMRIKGWSRAKKEALIAGDWARVSQLAVARGTHASTSSARPGGEDGTAPQNPVRAEPVEARAESATQ